MEKNLNPLYYLEEAIGGAVARRILKSAKKNKIDAGDIIETVYNKGTTNSKATARRILAKHVGNAGDKMHGQMAMGYARNDMKQLQKGGSELEKRIQNRKPGDFAKQFNADKIKRFRKEKAQKGKELIDSLL